MAQDRRVAVDHDVRPEADAAWRRRTISGPTPDASPIVIAIGARSVVIAPRCRPEQVDQRVRAAEAAGLGDDQRSGAVGPSGPRHTRRHRTSGDHRRVAEHGGGRVAADDDQRGAPCGQAPADVAGQPLGGPFGGRRRDRPARRRGGQHLHPGERGGAHRASCTGRRVQAADDHERRRADRSATPIGSAAGAGRARRPHRGGDAGRRSGEDHVVVAAHASAMAARSASVAASHTANGTGRIGQPAAQRLATEPSATRRRAGIGEHVRRPGDHRAVARVVELQRRTVDVDRAVDARPAQARQRRDHQHRAPR